MVVLQENNFWPLALQQILYRYRISNSIRQDRWKLRLIKYSVLFILAILYIRTNLGTRAGYQVNAFNASNAAAHSMRCSNYFSTLLFTAHYSFRMEIIGRRVTCVCTISVTLQLHLFLDVNDVK